MNAFSTTLEEQLEHTEWRTAVQRATDVSKDVEFTKPACLIYYSIEI